MWGRPGRVGCLRGRAGTQKGRGTGRAGDGATTSARVPTIRGLAMFNDPAGDPLVGHGASDEDAREGGFPSHHAWEARTDAALNLFHARGVRALDAHGVPT